MWMTTTQYLAAAGVCWLVMLFALGWFIMREDLDMSPATQIGPLLTFLLAIMWPATAALVLVWFVGAAAMYIGARAADWFQRRS